MRTYRGRTEEEQRAFNEERKALQRKKLEAKKANQPLPDNVADIVAEIEAEEVSIPKLSMKDRILSKFQREEEADDSKPKTKIEKEHIDKSEKLLSSVLPLTISALISIYAQRMFSEEYKECAPRKEEIATVLMPIFSIISRHVGIEGKASQDAIDMGSVLLAGMTVGTRMLLTADQIRRQQHVTNRSEQQRSDNSSAENIKPIRPIAIQNAADQYGGSGHDSRNGNGDTRPSPYADESSEATIVAELLRRDTEGRRQMGLAPRRVREAN